MIALGVAQLADGPAARSDSGGGYEEQLVAAFEGGAALRSASSTGAAIAARLYEAAFTSAVPSGPAAILDPIALGRIGRSLATRGEVALYAMLDGVSTRMRAVVASDWDVYGEADPATWRYRLTLSGPTNSRSIGALADAVIHPRIGTEPFVPWRGRSPLQVAISTGALAAVWERALREEGGIAVKLVTPMPASIEGMEQSHVNAMRREFQSHSDSRNKLFPPTTMRKGSDTPQTDWKAHRHGPSLEPAIERIYSAVTRATAGVFGVPAALCGIAESTPAGPSMREAWRQFVVSTIEPLGRVVEAELSRVLGAGCALSFRPLASIDLAARARAVNVLTQAGVPLAEARDVAGL